MLESISIWCIIPVHNRRETTLQCINHLKKTQEFELFEVLIVDDGSTDGTSEAIRRQHPDVTIIRGDGSLWWGGSIKKGMEYAADQGADIFIWVNDDVLPEPNGITQLAKKSYVLNNTVLTTMVSTEPESNYTTRNELTKFGIQSLPYSPDVEVQPCDVVAGKLTAFPKKVVDNIGFPDDRRFPHHDCDYDYTLRAKEHGFDVGVYSEVKAIDTGYDPEGTHRRLSHNISLEKLIKHTFLSGSHQRYTLRTMYYEYKRFYGPPKILCYILIIYKFIESFGAILIKILLTIIKKDHKLGNSN